MDFESLYFMNDGWDIDDVFTLHVDGKVLVMRADKGAYMYKDRRVLSFSGNEIYLE